MSRLDIVVFGATGFTGKEAVVELTKVAKKYDLTWAVAGRSEKKLQALMEEVSKRTGKDYSSTKQIVADVSDEKSLKEMCAQAKVVVNCCGPYRHYGEPVVKAAIDSKTHYVDVCGEPQFIETMQLVYDAAARDAGVFVVSACGMDSVPNDVGVAYMAQQFDGTLNSVESYLSAHVDPEYQKEASTHGVVNYGTWESLVYGLANYSDLGALRKKMYPERLPTFKPKLQPRGIHKRGSKWCVPFMGADSSIVYRSQRHLYEVEHKRPVQFKPYVTVGGIFATIGAVLAGMLLYVMTKTSFTRKLLLDYPRVFSFGFVSKEGPSQAVIANTHYKFELFGAGWARGEDEGGKPNKTIAVKVWGRNPGYGGTVQALLHCAAAVLTQRDRMPPSGGVLTTAIAFAHTDLVKNLHDTEMKFEVVDAKE